MYSTYVHGYTNAICHPHFCFQTRVSQHQYLKHTPLHRKSTHTCTLGIKQFQWLFWSMILGRDNGIMYVCNCAYIFYCNVCTIRTYCTSLAPTTQQQSHTPIESHIRSSKISDHKKVEFHFHSQLHTDEVPLQLPISHSWRVTLHCMPPARQGDEKSLPTHTAQPHLMGIKRQWQINILIVDKLPLTRKILKYGCLLS